MRKFVLSVVLLLSLALFGACGAAPAQTPSASATPFPTPTPSPTATVIPTPSPSPTPTVIPTPSPSPSPSAKAPAATKPAATKKPSATKKASATKAPAAATKKPAATPKPTPKATPKPSKEESATVYWTPSGEKYHISRNCATLKRSKTIKSGTIAQAGNRSRCKVCG